MNEYLSSMCERICKPISEDAPAGENAKYDERFDRVKAEVMKLTSGSAGMDWNAVLINSDELLSEKTKDLTLVAYLTLGLTKLNGFPGLATGLKILVYCLDNYWETMFPPVQRARARIQIFEWLNERVPIILGTQEATAEHADAVRESLKLIAALSEKAQSLITSQPISFGILRAEVAAKEASLPAPAPPPAEAAPATAPAQPENKSESTPVAETAAPANAPSEAAASPAVSAPSVPAASSAAMQPVPTVSEIGDIKEGLAAVGKIVNLIREAQPLSPVSYRLARVCKWEAIAAAPPADGQGQTKIPGPRDQDIQIFEVQLNAKNWAALREKAENSFLAGGPWLFNMNVQRYVFSALQGLGAADAAEVVMQEVGRFLLRFPEMVNYSYSTGLEFADGATKAWCEEAVASVSASGGGESTSDDTEWQNEAKLVAQKKNLVSALEIVQVGINETNSKQVALRRQLFGAKLCASHNSYHWAVPILESINKQISGMKLEEWEPDFCAEVWDNLLKGYNALKKKGAVDKEELDRQNQMRQQLFDVDLVKAVSVTPKP